MLTPGLTVKVEAYFGSPVDKERSGSAIYVFFQSPTFILKAGYFLSRAPFLRELSFRMYMAGNGAVVATCWIPA